MVRKEGRKEKEKNLKVLVQRKDGHKRNEFDRCLETGTGGLELAEGSDQSWTSVALGQRDGVCARVCTPVRVPVRGALPGAALTLVLICLAVSVRKMEELGSLALILVWAPCRAGKKVECSRAGLGYPILGATSLVILK